MPGSTCSGTRGMRRYAWRAVFSVVIMAGLTACSNPVSPKPPAPPPPPPLNSTGYFDCLKQKASDAVNSAPDIFKIDDKALTTEILNVCAVEFPNEASRLSGRAMMFGYITEAETKLLNEKHRKYNEEQRAQAERDAPKLAAENEVAARHYRDCLLRNVTSMAVISSEPADTLARVAFTSCSNERQALQEVHRRYHDYTFTDEFMDLVNQKLADHLVLAIIAARAKPPAAPAPKAAPPSASPPSRAPDSPI
jgi:hypothetical protein